MQKNVKLFGLYSRLYNGRILYRVCDQTTLLRVEPPFCDDLSQGFLLGERYFTLTTCFISDYPNLTVLTSVIFLN